MIVRGVNFFDEEVKKWKRKDFVDAHKPVFFTDMEMKEREKMLYDVYDRIKGKNSGVEHEKSEHEDV